MRPAWNWTGQAAALVLFASSVAVAAVDVSVRNADELRAAVAAAKPGARILLAGGSYGGGFQFRDVRGTAAEPIVIAAADPQRRPVFRDAASGLHFSNPAYLELRDLTFTALTANGLNIDDGGDRAGAAGGAHHIVLDRLLVMDVGQEGNHDGIKLSGVTDFRVRACGVHRWGTAGSAIDMVGCHRGVIEDSYFEHRTPLVPNANGVQCKGGSSAIVIRGNRFVNPGGRGVNLGGSTGLAYFRPPLVGDGPHFEARDLRVEGNLFIGAAAAVAFVGVDGAVVRFNTIEEPGRWALRILQENRAANFIPSRNGEFTDNVIVFDSRQWSEGGVNVGSGTAPDTFRFARNWWYCTDRPEQSRPRLPTPESDGVHGRPPGEAATRAGAAALPK